jgi:hypothetical protein
METLPLTDPLTAVDYGSLDTPLQSTIISRSEEVTSLRSGFAPAPAEWTESDRARPPATVRQSQMHSTLSCFISPQGRACRH